MSALYLHTRNPQWWQFITAAFCHYSWDHLSSNLFMLYTFGKIVEEEEGAGAVWLTYIVCAVGEGSHCIRLPMEAHARCLTKACGDWHSQLTLLKSACNKLDCLLIRWAAQHIAFAGASIASFFFDQGAVSLGASGAVFGLFAVAVLLKLKFSFQKLVGHLIGNSCHMHQYHGHDTQVVISQTD